MIDLKKKQKISVIIQLEKDLLKELDQLRKANGLTRAAVIRIAIDALLAQQSEAGSNRR